MINLIIQVCLLIQILSNSKMSFLSQNGPTFILRKICQRIQSKISETLFKMPIQLAQRQICQQRKSSEQNNHVKEIFNTNNLYQQQTHNVDQALLQVLKSDIVRIINASLPQVVNFETKINDKFEDFTQQIDSLKKLLKKQKQVFQESIIDRDNLKSQILQLENQNKSLFEQLEENKRNYQDAMDLVSKYMRDVTVFEQREANFKLSKSDLQQLKIDFQNITDQKDKEINELIHQKIELQKNNIQLNSIILELQRDLQEQRLKLRDIQTNLNMNNANYLSSQILSPKAFSLPQTKTLSNPESHYSQEINFPLQIKQKLNEAQKVLNRSPRSNDPKLQSDHYHLSSEIVGCQKQLLEIQLKQSQKEIVQLQSQLLQERIYSGNLEKQVKDLEIQSKRLSQQVDNLEKLLDGEKKLSEKLDKELYTLISVTKQLRQQLLMQRSKAKQLEDQISSLQQALAVSQFQQSSLRAKVSFLQSDLQHLHNLQQYAEQIKSKLQISQKKYSQLQRIKQELEQNVQDFQIKLKQLEMKETQESLKSENFQQLIKNQNTQKIRQIQDMSTMIKQKYQQKINIIEKQHAQLKEKYKTLKQQKARAYQGLEIQAKRQLKLEDKLRKANQKISTLQSINNNIQKESELLSQKLKSQGLLNKQLKRQLQGHQNTNYSLSQRLNKISQIIVPKCRTSIQMLNKQIQKIKSSIYSNKQQIKKILTAYQQQFQKASTKLIHHYQKKLHQLELQSELVQNKSALNQQQLNKFTVILETSAIQNKLINQKLSQAEKHLSVKQSQIKANQQLTFQINKKIKMYQETLKKFKSIQQHAKKLEKQVENYKIIEKSSIGEIQLLRQKQKEVEKFYDLVDELTKENTQLQFKLNKELKNCQKCITFNGQNKNSFSQYVIDQNQRIPKIQNPPPSQKSKPSITNHSHSCKHIRPFSHNKSSTGLYNIKHDLHYQIKSNQQNIPTQKNIHSNVIYHQLPIQSRQTLSNSHNLKVNNQLQQQQRLNLQYQDKLINQDFHNQKKRLQHLKQQFKQMMDDRCRNQFMRNNYPSRIAF